MTTYDGIRISDADRDAAVSRLSEHFASGRLTKDEYDERAEQAIAARFQADLAPLFADLPNGDQPRDGARPTRSYAPAWRGRTAARLRSRPVAGVILMPLLAIAAIATAIMMAPWLLFVLFWVAMCGGRFGWRRHRVAHRW